MSAPLLLSERDAALRLGVSRDTLRILRKAKRLKTVPWPGRFGFRIPLAEVERLALQGATVPRQAQQAKRRRGVDPAAAIRAIDVEAL